MCSVAAESQLNLLLVFTRRRHQDVFRNQGPALESNSQFSFFTQDFKETTVDGYLFITCN